MSAINISTSPAIFRWKPACWLRVTGDDAASFLQGQFTNDLRGVAPGRAVYGLWLTLKGKVLADSFVLRGEGVNEFWIGSYFSSATVIKERLESFVIADDVVVEDVTAQWAGVSLLGEGSGELGKTLTGTADFIFPGRRERRSTIECVYRVERGEPAAVAGTGWPTISDVEMARRRIAAGVPAVGVDVGGGDLPNEAGLEADAISYTKGCYLGQEVMARLKSMGQVRRRLVRVGGSGPIPAVLPAPVFIGSRQVGELRSVAPGGGGEWIGLAMVSLLHVTAEAKLSLAAEGMSDVSLLEAP